ncbi:MAG: glycosyltransferase family 9 protein [Nanoarchaeota archaeon]
MKKILVKRAFGSIGDMLMMIPAIEEIAKKGIVDLIIPKDFNEIFLNLNFIHDLIGLDENIEDKTYDEIFDLTDYEFNYEQIHQPLINKTKIEIFKDAFNISNKNNKIKINLSEKEKKWGKNFLKNNNLDQKRIILFAIKSANPTRDWKLEKWKALIKKLKKLNFHLIVIDKNLKWNDREIIFLNNLTFRELFVLVSISEAIICHDSGVLHIAGTFEKKTLGIFGPTNPKMRCVYKNSFWIDSGKDMPFNWYNRENHEDYFNSISVEDVERKFLEIISNE